MAVAGVIPTLVIVYLYVLSSSTAGTDATKIGNQANHTMEWKYKRMCYGIDYPRCCVSAAEKCNASRRIDIARCMADELTERVASALKFSQDEMKKHKKKTLQYQMAVTCYELFDSMDSDLETVKKCLLYRSHREENIGTSLSALNTNLGSCNEDYSERQAKSPFKKSITSMTELVVDLFWMAGKFNMLKEE